MEGDVEDEIVIPGLVGQDKDVGSGAFNFAGGGEMGLSLGGRNTADEEDQNLEDVEETLSERLLGLSEMFPDRFWTMLGVTRTYSYWFVRRTAWVLGTSAALVFLPPFLEMQRVEMEDMQNMQKKQMLLGPGQSLGTQYPPRSV